MKKWIVHWNNGYGDNYEIVEAETQEAADTAAYEAAREDWENNVADYSAAPYAKAEAVEHGLEDADENE